MGTKFPFKNMHNFFYWFDPVLCCKLNNFQISDWLFLTKSTHTHWSGYKGLLCILTSFGCCMQPKAGQTTFFQPFSTFLFILTFFSVIRPLIRHLQWSPNNGWKGLKKVVRPARSTKKLVEIHNKGFFLPAHFCSNFHFKQSINNSCLIL